jgi:hypothetical protein
MTLSGLTEPELDIKAQSAVIIAVAFSTNISANFVIFIGQEIVSRRKLIISRILTTYNVKAITQINIPLSNKYNIDPTTLYTLLTSNLASAIINGNFITFLLEASILLNSSSCQNAIVSNYTVSQMVLYNTQSPSLQPSSNIILAKPTPNLSQYYIIIVIFTSMGIFPNA